MKPVLSVLMAALDGRPWENMWGQIKSQAAKLPKGSVECLYEIDDGKRSSGWKRQLLSQRATGRYQLFVDDDDVVADDFLERIYQGCLSDVDVVSFDLKLTRPDHPDEIWSFGLHANARRDPSRPRPMTVNHLCAWRREIATRVAWCPDLGYGDDEFWFRPLFAAGLVRTHHHVNQVLYHYVFHPHTTVNQRQDRVEFSKRYFGPGLRCFVDWSGEIWIQDGIYRLLARNRDNALRRISAVNHCRELYVHRLKY